MNFTTKKMRRNWLKQINNGSCEIDTSYDFSCMDRYVENRKIVLIGESSHGIAEYYTTKINMIKYLHEKHGFNVVVLESGLLEGVLCKRLLDQMSPKEQIQHSLLDIFHNEEMIPLFNEPWANQIHIAGMDIQPTYPKVSNALLSWVQKHIDDELYNTLVEVEQLFFDIDKEIRGKTKIPKKLKQDISKCIEKYHASLEVTKSKIKNVENLEIHKMLRLVLRGIENRIKWLKINLQSFIASGVQRGNYMFTNLKWLIEDYYAGEKVIVWAHNFHIRKSKTITSKLFRITNVGQLLKDHYDEKIYSVGLYAGKGKFSSLLRVSFPINTSKKKHLENILLEANAHNCFVPLSNIDLPKRNWLNRRWWLLEAGMMGQLPIAIFPQKHYDAIMFCREVTPPSYFNGNEERAFN
ncbi:erythromycin esterase family protein [Alkalihalophilus lindianensis]|uniref:Erythromycin esterase family protein n=1 Tax=Alkalihalophilus lindianensis TaxID=1630542 RepID=A0ABU3XCL4_9BACI|nr:erythromycin esterase family protein [Alkalihalophilus lindianensis]MDV2685611.1 erythromycin esterase family protein [Alkalihalophilus lindianensis]